MRRRTVVAAVALAGAGAALAWRATRRDAPDRPPLDWLAAGEHLEVATSDGATLVVDVQGPEDGPTVVLAHCWGGHVDNWSLVARPLLERGHRVVRWHQRGHGLSTVGHEGFAIDRFGADLAEVLEVLDVRDAVVVGHSLGGMTAQAFAIGHPEVAAERTKGLVLVATAAGGLDLSPVARTTRPLGEAGHRVDRALTSRYGHLLVRGALGRGASPGAVRATRDHFVGTPWTTRHGIFEQLLSMDLRHAGGGIAVPTTVVVGSLDTLTPPRHSRAMAARIPESKLVVLRGRGHMLPFEDPDGLVAAIIDHHR